MVPMWPVHIVDVSPQALFRSNFDCPRSSLNSSTGVRNCRCEESLCLSGGNPAHNDGGGDLRWAAERIVGKAAAPPILTRSLLPRGRRVKVSRSSSEVSAHHQSAPDSSSHHAQPSPARLRQIPTPADRLPIRAGANLGRKMGSVGSLAIAQSGRRHPPPRGVAGLKATKLPRSLPSSLVATLRWLSLFP